MDTRLLNFACKRSWKGPVEVLTGHLPGLKKIKKSLRKLVDDGAGIRTKPSP
jgi:hypothetical protein